MEDNTRIHMDIDYKKKKVSVHLGFSEETNDKNIKIFYDSLKKIYIEKMDFRALKV